MHLSALLRRRAQKVLQNTDPIFRICPLLGSRALLSSFSGTAPSRHFTSGTGIACSDEPMRSRPWFHENGLSFACTACGKCCTLGPDRAVYVNAGDLHDLQGKLQLDVDTLVDRYVEDLPSGRMALVKNAKGDACVFLEEGSKRCSVYDARPTQCRTYPFWIENMVTPHDWEVEATRCEGIDPSGSGAARVEAGEAVLSSMVEEVNRSQMDLPYTDMRALLIDTLAQPEGAGLYAEFGEGTLNRFAQTVVHETDSLKVLDTRFAQTSSAAEEAPEHPDGAGAVAVPRAFAGAGAGLEGVRALIFKSDPSFIQTAVPLPGAGAALPPGAARGRLVLHPHQALALALALLPQLDSAAPQSPEPAGARAVAVIGAGGGALPAFLHHCLDAWRVDAVELSAEVADVAQQWFDLCPSPGLNLHVQEGRAFLAAAEPGLYDAVLVDVAAQRPPGSTSADCAGGSSEQEPGLVVPPGAFCEVGFLGPSGPVKRALKEAGVLAMNLVGPDDAIEQLEAEVAEYYAHVGVLRHGGSFSVLFASDGARMPQTLTEMRAAVHGVSSSSTKLSSLSAPELLTSPETSWRCVHG